MIDKIPCRKFVFQQSFVVYTTNGEKKTGEKKLLFDKFLGSHLRTVKVNCHSRSIGAKSYFYWLQPSPILIYIAFFSL
jgi:hypothetical protein